MPRDLRYDVLHHRAGLRERFRVIGADPRLVLGGTIAVLLVVVPAAITVGLVLAGTFGDDGGALAVLAMLFLGGLWTLGSLLREGAKGSALTRFARVNKLDVVEASAMPVYAGRSSPTARASSARACAPASGRSWRWETPSSSPRRRPVTTRPSVASRPAPRASPSCSCAGS